MTGPIPHILFFPNGQLPLFPEVIQDREELAHEQRRVAIRAILGIADTSVVIAHCGAITSPYQVEADVYDAVHRCVFTSDTYEEAHDLFLEWLDDYASRYLLS